jgi:hypothetical protein
LREEVGLERGLKSLRNDIEAAKSEVPKSLPAIAALEAGQARLKRELEAAKKKITATRVNQTVTDFKLGELRKAQEAQAAGLELKIETSVSTFAMREIHPDAGRALRHFADDVLKDHRGETLWVFEGTRGRAAHDDAERQRWLSLRRGR